MLRSLLFELVRRRWFFAALALGAAGLLLPRPAGLSIPGQRILAILVFAITCFLTEPVPLPAVALLIGVAEVLFGLKDPQEMPRSYMSGAVFFILGSLMIGASLVHQRLDRRIALLLIKVTGTRFTAVLAGLCFIAAILASFVGPHVVAATLMPVALALVRDSEAPEEDRGRMAAALLVALAYSCAVGGVGTPSGSARNAIMIEYWRSITHQEVDYAAWVLAAYPFLLLSAPLVASICLITFRPRTRDLGRAVATLRQEAAKQRNHVQAWLSLAIVALILLLFLTSGESLGIGTIAVGGASLFLVTGLVRWEQINAGVPWGVFLLYAATISMGISMSETGAAEYLARSFLEGLAPLGFGRGLPLLLVIATLTLLATNIMSGGPAVSVVGPIILAMAMVAGEDAVPVGYMVALASSFSHLTIMGNPPNSIVYASGQVHPGDFLRAGWKMILVSLLLALLFAAFYWPLVAR